MATENENFVHKLKCNLYNFVSCINCQVTNFFTYITIYDVLSSILHKRMIQSLRFSGTSISGMEYVGKEIQGRTHLVDMLEVPS
jgi:hypothetical protein